MLFSAFSIISCHIYASTVWIQTPFYEVCVLLGFQTIISLGTGSKIDFIDQKVQIYAESKTYTVYSVFDHDASLQVFTRFSDYFLGTGSKIKQSKSDEKKQQGLICMYSVSDIFQSLIFPSYHLVSLILAWYIEISGSLLL